MSGMIKNIVSEIEQSREQMLKIIDTLVEHNKDPKLHNELNKHRKQEGRF